MREISTPVGMSQCHATELLDKLGKAGIEAGLLRRMIADGEFLEECVTELRRLDAKVEDMKSYVVYHATERTIEMLAERSNFSCTLWQRWLSECQVMRWYGNMREIGIAHPDHSGMSVPEIDAALKRRELRQANMQEVATYAWNVTKPGQAIHVPHLGADKPHGWEHVVIRASRRGVRFSLEKGMLKSTSAILVTRA
jgi:hypothetical protein